MNSDPQQLHGIIAAFIGIYAIFYLLMAIAFMVPTGFIAKKAGLSPWLCLLCIFPLTGLILLFYIKRRRISGLVIALVGTVVVGAVFWLWVP